MSLNSGFYETTDIYSLMPRNDDNSSYLLETNGIEILLALQVEIDYHFKYILQKLDRYWKYELYD